MPVQEPPALPESTLLAAARGRRPAQLPVWFMRQAGRSLPEYRARREGTAMLQACQDPDLVTELTLQPVTRHGVDAAILFSDIVVPLVVAGIDVDIVPGVGPVLERPVRSLEDVRALPELDPTALGFLDTAVRRLVTELHSIPLIGFSGAPFTLAAYLIEGGPSKDHALTKAFMYGRPQLWDELLSTLAEYATIFLRSQAAAGASVLQLFDSWAGALPAAAYERFVLPYSRRVFASLEDLAVPRIHFGVGTGELLGLMADAGAEVVGVDWRVPLSQALTRIEPGHPVQGNLDPAILLADWPVIEAAVRDVVDQGRGAPGHIFNLGHGVLPQTDPEVLTRVVELVHSLPAR
ncbi:MAG: uroporphyrinogen decarboxylase [Actinomycetota bacterium]|nr:uroporphyrinogen decarboxylase [Geodermatophilaceae bacterium]MDQ3505249.1 uroporphyrinogen decarboxylase [Actinomycetota bacterium]